MFDQEVRLIVSTSPTAERVQYLCVMIQIKVYIKYSLPLERLAHLTLTTSHTQQFHNNLSLYFLR